MNTKNIFSFIIGAAIGSVSTYFIVKDKYEKIAQDEIDSVKETFSKLRSDSEKHEELTNIYKQKVSNLQYVCNSVETPVENKEELKVDEPYVISPDEFTEFEDYETISLTYYSDGILADDNDEIIEDVEGTVGEDSLEHFGEYEPDSVYVRNDRRKCDYEILLDERAYSDIAGPITSRNNH